MREVHDSIHKLCRPISRGYSENLASMQDIRVL